MPSAVVAHQRSGSPSQSLQQSVLAMDKSGAELDQFNEPYPVKVSGLEAARKNLLVNLRA